MPLLIASLDFNLSQPVARNSSAPRPTTAMIFFIRYLLSGLHFRRHQADFVNLRALGDIDGAGNVAIFEVGVALHKYDTLGARLEDNDQTVLPVVFLDRLRVQHYLLV